MNTPSTANPSASSSAASRPSIIQLTIKEKAALYAAYIPLFKDGGIFVPTPKEYALGDDVYLLLSTAPANLPRPARGRWLALVTRGLTTAPRRLQQRAAP